MILKGIKAWLYLRKAKADLKAKVKSLATPDLIRAGEDVLTRTSMNLLVMNNPKNIDGLCKCIKAISDELSTRQDFRFGLTGCGESTCPEELH